ncbi:MAG TPA: phage/plasmid replication protein, II/X family [Solimonas sp.]
MIDWITAKVPMVHRQPIFGGAVLAFDEDGCMKWKRESFRQLEGSFESTAVCQTHFRNDTAHRDAEATGYMHPLREVWISGNPSKFLQGHNLFGPDNLPALAPLFFRAVLEALGMYVDDVTYQRWQAGDYELDRVDVAYMLDVGGPAEVRDCLAALAHQATYANRGRGVLQAGTVQWGKRTARNTVVKAYDKYTEIAAAGKKRQLPETLPHRGDLYDFAVGKLRVEVEFHSRQLNKLNLRQGRFWHADTANIQWGYAMERLNISGQMPATSALLKALPRRLQRTYMQWESGRDLRAWMSSATFKRHRKDLLGHGVDIAQPFNADHKPRVISLQRVLQPVPALTPACAYGTSLLAAS